MIADIIKEMTRENYLICRLPIPVEFITNKTKTGIILSGDSKGLFSKVHGYYAEGISHNSLWSVPVVAEVVDSTHPKFFKGDFVHIVSHFSERITLETTGKDADKKGYYFYVNPNTMVNATVKTKTAKAFWEKYLDGSVIEKESNQTGEVMAGSELARAINTKGTGSSIQVTYKPPTNTGGIIQ